MRRKLLTAARPGRYLRWWLSVVPLCWVCSSFGQYGTDNGIPTIKYYTPKVYQSSATNWSVIQGNDGILYFGNTSNVGNVIQYDGVSWNKIKSPNSSAIARCFGKDSAGTIYYGGSGDFGYLAKDPSGTTYEHSLLEFVPRDKRNFFDVWSIQTTAHGVYFQTRERLFRLTKTGTGTREKWITKTWEPATHFMYSFYLDHVLFVHELGVGLLKMVDDSLVLIPGSEPLGKDRMQVMLPYGDNLAAKNTALPHQYLLGTFNHGLYLFDGKNFKPFATQLDPVLQKQMLYKGVKVNGNYVLSILGYGLVILDPQGKILQVINRNSGLLSDVVYSIYADPKKDLWLALDNGIAKVDINSPFTFFNAQSGITEVPFSIARLPNGQFFVGTNNGLLQFDSATAKFDFVDKIPRTQIFNLWADGKTLLVPSNGLYMIRDGKVLLVQPSVNNNLQSSVIFISKVYPSIMYLGSTFGVALFVRDPTRNTGWKYLGNLPEVKGEIHFITETRDGSIWALPQNGQPFLVTLSFDAKGAPDITKTRVEKFLLDSGKQPNFSFTFTLNHTNYFDTDSSNYIFDTSSHHFKKASFQHLFILAGLQDSTGRFLAAIGRDAENRKVISGTPLPGGGYQIDSTTFLPISDLASRAVYMDRNHITWFVTNDGLIRYDERFKENVHQQFKALVTGIASDTMKFNPDQLAGSAPATIQFTHNSIRFDYAAPFFEREDKTKYQTWLDGFDKTWSSWGKNTYKEYTNLPAGHYSFHVRALNIFEQKSQEASFEFNILPPWYGTWWAYGLYILLALLVLYLIINWRTRQLKAQHAELEKVVKERTAQLSQRVGELSVINSVQEGLVAQMNMEQIYTLVGDRIRDLFDAQTVVIRAFDHKNKLEVYHYAIEKGKRLIITPRSFDRFTEHLMDLKKPELVNDHFREYITAYSTEARLEGEIPKSALFVPMILGEWVMGNLSLQNVDHENAFSPSDVNLLSTLANSMSVALENARLFDETTRLLKETEQRTAELSVINSVQEGLAKELNMQAIYQLVGDRLSEVMHTLDIDIRLFSPETNQVFYPYMRDHGVKMEVPPGPLGGMSKYVYDTRETLIINEDLAGKMESLGSHPIPGTQMEKSFMAVPIMVGNKVMGMVSISNYEKEHAFSTAEVRLLQTVVSAMSVALENARLFDETSRLLKETEQRTAELAVINSIQEGLVREMNTESIYQMVGDRICSLFPETQSLVIRTFDHQKGLEQWRYAIEKGIRIPNETQPLIWANKELLVSKKPILINENYLETAKKYGSAGVSTGQPPKSAVFVPMIVGDEVKGSLSLQNVDKENAFTSDDIRLLATVTNSMSVAIENARLFDETTHLLAEAKLRASELGTVNNISKALASKLDAGSLIQLVGDQLKNLFKANIVYLALLDKKTSMISFPYQYGDILTPMKLGKGLTSNIILKGEPLLINKDVHERTGELGLQRIGLPAASYLGVPIPVGDEITGVLSVQSTEQENRFNENDLRLLSTIASSVGVALKNAQLFEDVQQAKMEAEQASKIAEKANEAKSAFLSTVSHELRTPLTSVLGFAKIIKKRLEEKIFTALDISDPKTEKTVHQISENLNVVISEGERLTHLINDVLDLAKIEAGKMEWSRENVSLSEVIQRAVAATTALFEQKNIELVTHLEEGLPEITGDTDKLIQVVINLFSNAVKFTSQGHVSCNLYQQDGQAVVSVQDTGIGIAKEDFGAVFEQFKQVGGDTLTDKPKGTGLGLPICKEIVEHHGGRIWLESQQGKGSTFFFSIPLNTTGSAGTHLTSPIHLNELVKQLKEQMVFSNLKTGSENATILVVDDDNSIRSLLHQELSDAGYLIEEAKDGKMALESIRKKRPDLIILDVMMPEINGFDVAAILKNDPQTMDIPIIILSIVQDKARGFRIGVDRYLTKPIDTTKLFEEVGSLLEQGKSKRKVMVVDEDSSAVRSLTEVLQAKGYIVVESDGKELLEKAVSLQPDIIILNSMTPDNNHIVQTLRFEKGLENVLFFIYQ